MTNVKDSSPPTTGVSVAPAETVNIVTTPAPATDQPKASFMGGLFSFRNLFLLAIMMAAGVAWRFRKTLVERFWPQQLTQGSTTTSKHATDMKPRHILNDQSDNLSWNNTTSAPETPPEEQFTKVTDLTDVRDDEITASSTQDADAAEANAVPDALEAPVTDEPTFLIYDTLSATPPVMLGGHSFTAFPSDDPSTENRIEEIAPTSSNTTDAFEAAVSEAQHFENDTQGASQNKRRRRK